VDAPAEGPLDWVETCELVPRRLKDRRAPGVRLVFLGLGFAAAGVLFLVRGLPWPFGVLTELFGGAGAVVGVMKVVRPGVLVIDAEGFSYQQALGRRWKQSWSDCEGIGVSAVGRTQMVTWRSGRLRETNPRSSRMARSLSGGEGGMPPAAGGMDARHMAALLTRYQERYGAAFPQDRAIENPE
jgi:hypothetical protein